MYGASENEEHAYISTHMQTQVFVFVKIGTRMRNNKIPKITCVGVQSLSVSAGISSRTPSPWTPESSDTQVLSFLGRV